MDARGMGRGREVDELAPATPNALATLCTLALVASAPWVALMLVAWVSKLMG